MSVCAYKTVRGLTQTKLDSGIVNAPFLLNEYGDPHFLSPNFIENNILNNLEKKSAEIYGYLFGKQLSLFVAHGDHQKSHCGVRASMATPSFCYVFIISFYYPTALRGVEGRFKTRTNITWYIYTPADRLDSFPALDQSVSWISCTNSVTHSP